MIDRTDIGMSGCLRNGVPTSGAAPGVATRSHAL
jgi:hypothetical protein